jgi:hypothetical protein
MEKTKNLNLSDAEKQDQKNKELESRLGGLIQKFEDQIITLERFESEYRALREEYNITGRHNEQLLKVLCARIELGKDNQALVDLLSQFADSNIEGIISVLQDFDTAIQAAAVAQSQVAKDELASAHFISGSAVVPNLENDPAWHKMAGEIRSKYWELLNQAKTKLLAA